MTGWRAELHRGLAGRPVQDQNPSRNQRVSGSRAHLVRDDRLAWFRNVPGRIAEHPVRRLKELRGTGGLRCPGNAVPINSAIRQPGGYAPEGVQGVPRNQHSIGTFRFSFSGLQQSLRNARVRPVVKCEAVDFLRGRSLTVTVQ